jgi:hypothetical protein
MEDPSSSETVAHSQQITCHHAPEDKIPQQYECQKQAHTVICLQIFNFSPNTTEEIIGHQQCGF